MELQDKIPDTVVLKKAAMQSMNMILQLAKLRRNDTVIRMPDEPLPKMFSIENFY